MSHAPLSVSTDPVSSAAPAVHDIAGMPFVGPIHRPHDVPPVPGALVVYVVDFFGRREPRLAFDSWHMKRDLLSYHALPRLYDAAEEVNGHVEIMVHRYRSPDHPEFDHKFRQFIQTIAPEEFECDPVLFNDE
jgi:hypothetical protein